MSRDLSRQLDRVVGTFDSTIEGYALDRVDEALREDTEFCRLVEAYSEVDHREDARRDRLRRRDEGDLRLDDEGYAALRQARRSMLDAIEVRGHEVIEDTIEQEVAGHSVDLRHRSGHPCPTCGRGDRLLYLGTRSVDDEDEAARLAPRDEVDLDRVEALGWVCHGCRSTVEEVVVDDSATWDWLLVDAGDALLSDVERSRDRDRPHFLRLDDVIVGPALDLVDDVEEADRA